MGGKYRYIPQEDITRDKRQQKKSTKTDMRRGICALEIRDPVSGRLKKIYAIQDPKSPFTLLRKSAARALRLFGKKHEFVGGQVEEVQIHLYGLKRQTAYALRQVKIIDENSKWSRQFEHHVDITSRRRIGDIMYPVLDRDQCDLIIGADNLNLITPLESGVSNERNTTENIVDTKLGWVMKENTENIKKNKHPEPRKATEKTRRKVKTYRNAVNVIRESETSTPPLLQD